MLLRDLVKYIPSQTRAISRLSGINSTADQCSWNQFRESLWGKGLESLQRQESAESVPRRIYRFHGQGNERFG